MIRLIHAEWFKIRRSILWVLAVISPLLAAGAGMMDGITTGASDASSTERWVTALAIMSVLHALLFLPLLSGVYAAVLCRYEHIGGGWKQLLSLPVSRTQLYVVKLLYILLLLAVTQLLFLGALLALGLALDFGGPIPWEIIGGSVAGGWLACLPLAALQLAVSTAWPSFAAPLAVNVILTLPNMMVANSLDYGPYYPWAQPVLAMAPFGAYGYGAFNISSFTLYGVVLGSFLVFLAAGWLYFTRKSH